jgi:hypothetical protein
MKIMLNHSSAKHYEETRHINKSTKNKTLSREEAGADGRRQGPNGTSAPAQEAGAGSRGRKTTISKALRRHAQAVIKDKSIDAQSRALIRYALETNDPWLAELVRRADAGETIIYTVNSLKHPHPGRRFKRRKD